MPIGHRQALPQGTRGHFHPGGALGVGVALEIAPELAQGEQLLPGEKAQAGQDRVEHRRGVALTEDKIVPVGIAGIPGVQVHVAEKQGHQDIGGGQGTADMPGAGPVEHLHDVQADLPGHP